MCSLDCERHTELVGLCQAQVCLCRAVPGCCASRYTRTAGCPFLSPAASSAAHLLLQAGCWPSACCCVVLQDDAGPGLEEPASSLQLAQLRLQEQLDARACARLCWLQMEGPYRLCRLGPYITPPSPKKEERGCTFMFVAIELFCQHGLAQVVSKDLKQGLAVVRCCC